MVFINILLHLFDSGLNFASELLSDGKVLFKAVLQDQVKFLLDLSVQVTNGLVGFENSKKRTAALLISELFEPALHA